MKSLSVIQHTSAEYLGLMEDHLEGRRIRFNYYRPFAEGGPLPHPDAMGDGLVLLGGGPWGSAGTRDAPTLKEEINLATTCLMMEKPVIGIGLGAQVLALAAGGRVEPADLRFSIGTAKRVDDDALNGFLPETYPLVTFMRDRYVLPVHARVLAEDETGEPALFQIGPNALGFLGHPGMKPAIIEDLIMEFEDGPGDTSESLARLQVEKTAIEDALVPIMTGIVQMTGWMGSRQE